MAKIKKIHSWLILQNYLWINNNKFLKILNNPDLAQKMGEAGRKLVETEFSSEKVAEKFIEEYNQIINNYETPSWHHNFNL